MAGKQKKKTLHKQKIHGRSKKKPRSDHSKIMDRPAQALAATKMGYVSGNTFKNKVVEYSVVDGMAVFEGDIILGTADEMETIARNIEEQPYHVESVVRNGEEYRWPWGIIPFTIDSQIDSQIPNRQDVIDAIQHWEDRTPIRFVPYSSSDKYWVAFRPGKGCSSHVGKRPACTITLDNTCKLGNIIHEIGHAVGLWHEQSRGDRDLYVNIVWNNIVEDEKYNFYQNITDGDDVGTYDYCSIMHYSLFHLCKQQPCPSPPCPCVGPTIQVLQPTLPCASTVGQRTGLSAGDIAAVKHMYGRLLTSGPGAVSWDPGRIDVFGRGKDNGLWHQRFDGTWHSWEYLGGGC